MELTSYSLQKTNEVVLNLVKNNISGNSSILDLGAGEGYLADRVLKSIADIPGENRLTVCDLFPENFKAHGIKCDKVDINQGISYPDAQFDIVYSVEVFEHVENQFELFKESCRILKPGGIFIFTTPNILNINSRIKYFLNGFYLLFDIMPLKWDDPQHAGGHINPTSLYYVCYQAIKNGFDIKAIHVDRLKKSGIFWSLIFLPLIKIGNLIYKSGRYRKNKDIFIENRNIVNRMNRMDILASRTIIMELQKK